MLMHVFVLCDGAKVSSQYDNGVRKELERVFFWVDSFWKIKYKLYYTYNCLVDEDIR